MISLVYRKICIILIFYLKFSPWLLTRFLVCAEESGVNKIKVILNKTDIIDSDTLKEHVDLVKNWGYEVFPCNIFDSDALKKIQNVLKD